MNTIAVDAMGGDSAPEEIVKGAIKAKNLGIDIILCGDKNLIEPFLQDSQIPVVHYPEVISMDDDPARLNLSFWGSPGARGTKNREKRIAGGRERPPFTVVLPRGALPRVSPFL